MTLFALRAVEKWTGRRDRNRLSYRIPFEEAPGSRGLRQKA
jgi:hypothetical protein